jgi:hypothetical protein
MRRRVPTLPTLPPDVAAALPGWLVARAAVLLGILVALVVAEEFLPGARPVQLDQGLFAWDAAFYRDIADVGYDDIDREGLRFFPLVPLLSSLLAVPLLGAVGPALILVSNAAALAAGALLHRLAVVERGDAALASRAAWLVALLPPAAVLVLGYAESTMMALSIGAFLCLRSQRWWGAAVLGFLAGLSRPVGGLLALPAAIEAARGIREAPAGERAGRLAAVVGPAAGVVSYLAWVHVTFGSWRLPMELHDTDELRGEAVNPIVRAVQAVVDLAQGELLGEGLHAPWIVAFVVLTVVAFRRWPASYGAYAAAMLLVALSAESLGSFERYGLSAFPLLLALATITDRPVVDRIVVTGCAAGLTAFTAMTMLGTFVP